MRLNLVTLFAISVLAISCGKDVNQPSDNSTYDIAKLLSNTYNANTDIEWQYSYDNKNRITKIVRLDQGNVYSTDQLTYLNDTLISYDVFNNGGVKYLSQTFSYDNRTVYVTAKQILPDSNIHSTTYLTFLLNEKQQLIKSVHETDVDTLEYDIHGNCVKLTEYRADTLHAVKSYTYDDKKGYISRINMPQWSGYLPYGDLGRNGWVNNSVLEVVNRPEFGDVVEKKSKYHYDTDGYPNRAYFTTSSTKDIYIKLSYMPAQ